MLPLQSEPDKCSNRLDFGSSSVETRDTSCPLFEAEPRRNMCTSYPTTFARSNAFIGHNKVQSAIVTSVHRDSTNRYDFVQFLDQLRLRYGVSSLCSITLIMDRYLAVEATQQNGIPVTVAAVFSLHMKLEFGELLMPPSSSREDVCCSPYDYLCMNVEDIAQRMFHWPIASLASDDIREKELDVLSALDWCCNNFGADCWVQAILARMMTSSKEMEEGKPALMMMNRMMEQIAYWIVVHAHSRDVSAYDAGIAAVSIATRCWFSKGKDYQEIVDICFVDHCWDNPQEGFPAPCTDNSREASTISFNLDAILSQLALAACCDRSRIDDATERAVYFLKKGHQLFKNCL